MGSATTKHLRQLSEALEQTYMPATVAEAPYRCLAAMKAILPGTIFGWNSFSTLSGEHEVRIVHPNHDAGTVDQANRGVEQHIHDHPMLDQILQKQVAPVSTLGDYMIKRRLRDTGLYSQGYKIMEVDDHLAINFRVGDQAVCALTLIGGFSGYREHQRALAAMLIPHFRQILRNARIYTAAQHQQGGYTVLLEERGAIVSWPEPLAAAFHAALGTPHPPAELLAWVREQVGAHHPAPSQPAAHRAFRVVGGGKSISFHYLPPQFGFCLHVTVRDEVPLASSGLELLTRRESEVLKWVASGKRDWEVAKILGISVRTAEQHVTNILRKLQVETRTNAALLYTRG